MTEPAPRPPGESRPLGARRVVAELAAAALSGLLSVVVPAIGVKSIHPEAVSPLVAEAVERFDGLLLLPTALALGVLTRANFVLVGLATMAAFPLFAVADMARDPTSHNLWPFEFFLYLVFGCAAALGVGAGRILRTFWLRYLVR